MTRPVANLPQVLSTTAVVAGSITVTTNAQLGAAYTVPAGGFTELVVNDCTSLATASAGNAILTVSAGVLALGTVIPTSATTSGFVVSQLPSGVGISVTAGTAI